jgi:transposase-like protein
MLGLGNYVTPWLCLHKLRRAMVRDGRDPLTGNVEVDETFVGGVSKGGFGKRNKKALVGIAAEIRGTGIGRIRLGRLSDSSTPSVVAFVQRSVAPGSTVVTDGGWPYRAIVDHGYTHLPTSLKGKGDEASKAALPRVHRIASLMKRWMLGMHQGRIDGRKIDSYLDEFAFRFNRRLSPDRGMLFYRLLQQCVLHPPTTSREMKRKNV